MHRPLHQRALEAYRDGELHPLGRATTRRPEPEFPYAIVLTIPMPGKASAEDLATAYRREWAECPEVTIEVVAASSTATIPERRGTS